LEEKNKQKEAKKEIARNLKIEYNASLKSLEDDLKARQEKHQSDLQKKLESKRFQIQKKLQREEGLSPSEEAVAKAEQDIEDEEGIIASITNDAITSNIESNIANLNDERDIEIKRLKTLGFQEDDYMEAMQTVKDLHKKKLETLQSALSTVKETEQKRLALRLEEKKKKREEIDRAQEEAIARMKDDFEVQMKKTLSDSNVRVVDVNKIRAEHESALNALEKDLEARHQRDQKDIKNKLENKRLALARRLQEESSLSLADAQAKASALTQEEEKFLMNVTEAQHSTKIVKLKQPTKTETYNQSMDMNGDGTITDSERAAYLAMHDKELQELNNANEEKRLLEKKRLDARLQKKKDANSAFSPRDGSGDGS
jgi:hypothetical protein